MLHNEARKLLVEAYEKTHNAKGIALAYGVSVPTVYRLAEQNAKTGSVDLRVSERGRKRKLGQEALEKIARTIDTQPDITLREIVETLELPIGIETVQPWEGRPACGRSRAAEHTAIHDHPVFHSLGWGNGLYDLPGRNDRR